MRNFILLAGAALPLAACGGAGPQSAGSVASPASPVAAHTFVNPTETKTYEGLGVAQHYEYKTASNRSGQYDALYAGDANTARDSGISVTYDPRDAIFDVTISRPKAIVAISASRFQDPVHRTAFGGAREPQAGVPVLADAKQIQYLQSGSSTGFASVTPGSYAKGEAGFSSTVQTLFYQKPGTTTNYVSYAGFVRSSLSTTAASRTVTNADGTTSTIPFLENSYAFDRSLFAYGERTGNSAIPKTGSGTYTGDMLATMVYNTLLDTNTASPTYFQWISGSHSTSVDFASLAVATTMTGTVSAPTLDAYTNGQFAIPAGATFTASAKAAIDLVGKGGFTGTFQDARFKVAGQSDLVLTIAGSSIDGAFFGPNAEELGAGFRVVGGKPDQRIDILGVVTGKK